MNSSHLFISHATKDDGFVKKLREALESFQLAVWVDSRKLSGGSKLEPEIETAIEEARHFIAVISPDTVNSPWVRREIQKALEVARLREEDGYKVIPLLLPGIEPAALVNWFDEEPVGVKVELKTAGVSEALPAILAALGERLPTDPELQKALESKPVEELILELRDPKIKSEAGERRITAVATLVYEPASSSARRVESKRYNFTAPIGPIETDDLRWYLEEYFRWPHGIFQERAERIESKLPLRGQDLFDAALAAQSAQEALTAWQQTKETAERRFSILVDSDLPEGATDAEQAAAREAASELLSLPWELLNDGRGYLFHGKSAVRVRRRLPNRYAQAVTPSRLPIRILLVSPRPEEEGVGYIDHRISAKPLVEAIEALGELVTLTLLTPPTFSALESVLQKAADAGQPFDVVHFDGHGIFDRKVGLGGLCFEDPKDNDKLERRAMQLIHAEKLAEVMRDHRIPLVFLEACQSAKTEDNPTASVAARLLQEGVTSVIAMSHSVLVGTARRFVKAFYLALAEGKRVGAAMLAGQQALYLDTWRGRVMGAGELHLQDWFVPVIYQEEQDPQLITKLLPEETRRLQEKQRNLSLGRLPEEPPHHFVGRSRELLKIERLLHKERYAVVCGIGGEGKTTLAAELARWLVQTRRFRRAAFVSLEYILDARAVLDSLGKQLLPEGENYSVAEYPDMKQALQPVERALGDRPTLVVLDNLESVLPDSSGQLPAAAPPVGELFALCRSLLDAHPLTRIVFTSREWPADVLPAPFNRRANVVQIGALSRNEAIELVGEVMKDEGLEPKYDDAGNAPQDITDLVEAVGCHARALTLLAREVSRSGVRSTTENLHKIMAELHYHSPDDRESSLYASVKLSLDRLTTEMREQIKPLGVFHGGASLGVLQMMLGVDDETVKRLGRALIDVGLAEEMAYGHLRLDPALPPYLSSLMNEIEREEIRARWAEAMAALTNFLYQQQFKDVQIAASLTLLELPNLMAMLGYMATQGTTERVIILAQRIESQLSKLGRRQALVQATKIREKAAQGLEGWGHSHYHARYEGIHRLIEQGNLPAALTLAQQLRQKCLEVGRDAYPEAAYDTATAYHVLGRILQLIGEADTAIVELSEAKQMFESLASCGDSDAERLIAVTTSDLATCYISLGHLDIAVAHLDEAIKEAQRLDDQRQVAICKHNLGIVHLQLGDYMMALSIHKETKTIFEVLGEQDQVAGSLFQIGRLYLGIGRFDESEEALREALKILVQQKNPTGEAMTLTQLGSLYDLMNRLTEATTAYQQATNSFARLQDRLSEGKSRISLAQILIREQKYDQARVEINRGIECIKPFGHTAEPWKAWDTIQDLEQATGNANAAAQARQKAIECYLAYRRDGGVSQNPRFQLYALVAQAIIEQNTSEAEQLLDQLSATWTETWAKALVAKLQAILRGDRDPALAADPDLYYMDAVELQLLLEALKAADEGLH